MRTLLAVTALLLATTAAPGALADARLELPDRVRQGELVIGRKTDRKSTRLNSSH